MLLDRPSVSSGVAPVRPRRAYGGVTVIIPCFNEQAVIGETVEQVNSAMQETHRPYEIIVVDDGSVDESASNLESGQCAGKLKIIRNGRNRGYGYSIKRAVREAAYEIVAITDADGTYPNERIGELVSAIQDVDMVVGARTGLDVHIPWVRRPAKWALRKLASYLANTNIPDLNSGLRVMKRSLIRRFIHLLPDGFSFTTTITLAMLTHGYEVRFVPIDYARRIGRSSIRPIRDTLNFISLIVRTVMYFRPLKVFAPASALLLLSALVLGVVSKLVFGALADVSVLVIAMASVQLLGIGLLADLIDKRVLEGHEREPTQRSLSRGLNRAAGERC